MNFLVFTPERVNVCSPEIILKYEYRYTHESILLSCSVFYQLNKINRNIYLELKYNAVDNYRS